MLEQFEHIFQIVFHIFSLYYHSKRDTFTLVNSDVTLRVRNWSPRHQQGPSLSWNMLKQLPICCACWAHCRTNAFFGTVEQKISVEGVADKVRTIQLASMLFPNAEGPSFQIIAIEWRDYITPSTQRRCLKQCFTVICFSSKSDAWSSSQA